MRWQYTQYAVAIYAVCGGNICLIAKRYLLHLNWLVEKHLG